VPYYRELFADLGFDPEQMKSIRELEALPLLTRDMVRELGDRLVAEGVPRSQYRYQTTGGTSGQPLGFAITHDASAMEWAFMTRQWGRVGYRPGDRRVVLRGRSIPGRERGVLSEHDPLNAALFFSSFDLTEENLALMLPQMVAYEPRYVHAYPSSATILAKHLLRTGSRLPSLRALLLGSENMAPGQREFLEESFGVRVFTWYGHSEKCILAGECERDSAYHPFAEYGVTELVDGTGAVVSAAGVRGTLVGTGFLNRATVFIRYLTDDSAQWVDEPCACGRPGRRLAGVVGRWTQEMLVGRDGALVSMTAINLHSAVYARIGRFRFVQERPGEAELLVVPADSWDAEAERELLSALDERLSGRLAVTIRVIEELPLTMSGKSQFVDQRLDVAALTRGSGVGGVG